MMQPSLIYLKSMNMSGVSAGMKFECYCGRIASSAQCTFL
ncbi:Hypothetical protein ETEE_1998 [Edwardsiella anguillarum ET080813]|uniref:Uncharacterized protein n=1 Tax=Edwardsiella anguillarum ET080813 TaxID=667120 RepID=A0A076LP89_9GAMM|nr:Hypothetical protein ETEE_1998 [Edwardsiella anguillarum ET080813]